MCPSKLKAVLAIVLSGILLPAQGAPPEAKDPVRTDANGDPLPPGALLRLGTGRFRHTGWNRTLAFFSDGETFVSMAEENSLRFWETATGKLLGEFETDDAIFAGFDLSLDGKRVALAGRIKDSGDFPSRGAIRIWDAKMRQNIRTMLCGEREVPSQVLFTPDGKTLVSNGGAGLRIWDAEAGTELLRERLGGLEIRALALSPDGKLVAAGGDTEFLYLWEWDSGKEPRKIKLGERYVSSLAFSPDGKRLAVWSDSEGGVQVRDAASGRSLLRLTGHDSLSYATGLAFSPDGKLLATSDAGNRIGSKETGGVLLWDSATGIHVRTLPTPGEGIGKLAFSRDGRWLAACGRSGLRVWDMRSGKEVLDGDVGHRGRVERVAVSASGLIASASIDHTVRLWDSAAGKHLHTLRHRGNVRGIAISPDGKRLVSNSLGDTMYLWDTATGRPILKLPGHSEMGGRRTVAFTADGKRFLSSGDDFYLRVTDVTTGKALQEDLVRPTGVAIPDEDADDVTRERARLEMMGADTVFSPDGKTFILIVGNGFRVLDVATNKELRTIPGEGSYVVSMALSPDGKHLAASAWGKQVQTKLPDGRVNYSSAKHHPICVWDIATGKRLHLVNLLEGGAGPVAFSADSRHFAAAVGRPRPRITIWEMASGKAVRTFEKIGGVASALAFSPDSRRLFSGMEDTTVLIWDLTR